MTFTAILERHRSTRIPDWNAIIPRAARYALDVPISVFHEHRGTSFFRLKDLSVSGARLKGRDHIDISIGQKIELDLPIKQHPAAVVVRKNGGELAVEFENALSNDVLAAIVMYLDNRYDRNAVGEANSLGLAPESMGSVAWQLALSVGFIVGAWSILTAIVP